MTLWVELDRTGTPAGDEIILRRKDDIYEIRFNGLELMSSFNHQSETMLAERSLRLHGRPAARVLIGGLGMGFTLRTALDCLDADATVTVCELVPGIVDWNRRLLGHLAGNPLRDYRVRTIVDDVRNHLGQDGETYDVILMDTDNGPDITVRETNNAIYSTCGLEAVFRSLSPGGIAAFWSATVSDDFEHKLEARSSDWQRQDICLVGGRSDAFHHIYFVRSAERSSAGTEAGIVASSPASERMSANSASH